MSFSTIMELHAASSSAISVYIGVFSALTDGEVVIWKYGNAKICDL